MTEHKPEIGYDKSANRERPYFAHCLYPWSCSWRSRQYATEAEAKAAMETHLDMTAVAHAS